jgi:hypothetical protein
MGMRAARMCSMCYATAEGRPTLFLALMPGQGIWGQNPYLVDSKGPTWTSLHTRAMKKRKCEVVNSQ